MQLQRNIVSIFSPLASYQPGIVDARDDVTGPDDPFALNLRSAAVMVPVLDTDDGPALILTQRSAHLRQHAGQISFPGGKVEPHDKTPWDAALRETTEEIGLAPEQFTPVVALDRYRTLTGFEINPWLAMVTPPFLFRPQPEEVAEIFTLPLSVILGPDAFKWQERTVNNFRRGYYMLEYQNRLIWGATAGILANLAHILAQSDQAGSGE